VDFVGYLYVVGVFSAQRAERIQTVATATTGTNKQTNKQTRVSPTPNTHTTIRLLNAKPLTTAALI